MVEVKVEPNLTAGKQTVTPCHHYSLYKHSKTKGKHYEKAGENKKVLESVKEVDFCQ